MWLSTNGTDRVLIKGRKRPTTLVVGLFPINTLTPG